MNFDFGYDGMEDSVFDAYKVSKSSKKKGASNKRNKRTLGNTSQSRFSAYRKSRRSNKSSSCLASNPSSSPSSNALPGDASVDTNSSYPPSSPSSGQSKAIDRRMPSNTVDKSSRRSRRRVRLKYDEEHSSSMDDDELRSKSSHVSSFYASSSNSSNSTATDSIAITRPNATTIRSHLSVRRGAGSSAYAVQDAGTYQMVHDECSYLCSTILSRQTCSSKATNAAIELATLLSSRKTRSILWQGGSHDRDVETFDDDDQRKESSSRTAYRNPQVHSSLSNISPKISSIPKIWSSIFEVLALPAMTCDSFENFSSNSSVSSTNTTADTPRIPPNVPSPKCRTKSARRKEKELLQTGSRAISIRNQTTGFVNNHRSVTSKGNKLNPDLKNILACIFYFVSWDCTISSEYSIAAMGAVKSFTVARKVRLAILERGAVLNGLLRLMAPSQRLLAIATEDSLKQVAYPSKISATTTKILNPTVSPLHARTIQISKKSASMETSSYKVPDVKETVNGIASSTKQAKTFLSLKIAGDPTALGRRKRKKRRKLKEESFRGDQFPHALWQINTESISHQDGSLGGSKDTEIMPPPSNRRVVSLRRKTHGSEELSFTDVSVLNQPAQYFRKECDPNDDGSSAISEATLKEASNFTSRLLQKVDALSSKVHIESLPRSRSLDIIEAYSSRCVDSQESICFRKDSPWLSLVCLESLTRILTGKGLDGKTSCLEEEEASRSKGVESNDDDNDDDEKSNIVIVTNCLVAKSGIIPLLSSAMSQSLAAVMKLIRSDKNSNESNCDTDEEYWIYCHHRMRLLSSIIDEACFFSERNRRSFCEDDPFSFQERKKGLIFHILIFLRQCSRSGQNQLNQKRDEIMSLALRTLTSLTHDNPLAAEQMKIDCDFDFNDNWSSDNNIQGIHVLADLIFQLEETPPLNNTKAESGRASDHDMHRYDSTIFCLTTLANVIEGSGIGRMLTEIKLVLHSGTILPWLEWICQWLIKQTETFRQEILSIGNSKMLKKSPTKTTTSEIESGEINQDEVEKLVAAGNGCVVLACLMTESDDDDPESSIAIRNLIKKQMPLNSDGSSSGLLLIINTLRAYCNYYHMSMGEMSVAVVSPVRKLIHELEEITKVEEDLS